MIGALPDGAVSGGAPAPTAGESTAVARIGCCMETSKTSERRAEEPAAKVVPDEDRRQVQGDDDQEQEDRRRIDHRDGCLDVGTLKADVVEVEPEMHDFPVEVKKREDTVSRKRGRELHDADDHERGHLAGA